MAGRIKTGPGNSPRLIPRRTFAAPSRHDADLELQNLQFKELVLSDIPDTPVARTGKIRSMVFLATPTVGHLIEDVDFLRDIISRVCGPGDGSRPRLEIESIAAVVDALPSGRSKLSVFRPCEGLSVFMSSAPKHSSTPRLRASEYDDEDATLTFLSSVSRPSLAGTVSAQITLPVANTVFLNGMRATLFEDKWSLSEQAKSNIAHGGRASEPSQAGGKEDAHSIFHSHRRALLTATIDTGCSARRFDKIKLPLTPLTSPRKITKAMGNVVAEIQVEDEPVPASKELETAVSKYIEDDPDATSNGPLMIYALVRPPGMEATSSKPALYTHELLNVHQSCARLFKVTGGGGGWGKKQGLLSLDPAVDFRRVATTSGFPDVENMNELTGISEPKGMMPAGSTIQFWTYAAKVAGWTGQRWPGYAPPLTERPDVGRSINVVNRMSIYLGTGPGAAGETSTPAAAGEIPSVICQVGYFGMLSNGRAAVGSFENLGQMGSRAPELFSATKSRIDVPGTFFRAELVSPRQSRERLDNKKQTANEDAERGKLRARIERDPEADQDDQDAKRIRQMAVERSSPIKSIELRVSRETKSAVPRKGTKQLDKLKSAGQTKQEKRPKRDVQKADAPRVRKYMASRREGVRRVLSERGVRGLG